VNALEHYIKEIHKVEAVTDDWTKEFNKNFLEVTVTTDCHGNIETRSTVVSEDEWREIKNRGYFMW
jgi:hypothetical protein